MIACAWHMHAFDCAINDSWTLVRDLRAGGRHNRTSMFAHKTWIPRILLCVSRRYWHRYDVFWNRLSASFEGRWAMRRRHADPSRCPTRDDHPSGAPAPPHNSANVETSGNSVHPDNTSYGNICLTAGARSLASANTPPAPANRAN